MAAPIQGRKLRRLLGFFWLLPGAFALCASSLIFLSLGWIEYRNANERAREDLMAKAEVAARRLAAELLIDGGSVVEVEQYLVKSLGIGSLSVVKEPDCRVVDGACVRRKGSLLTVYRRVPHLPQDSFVAVSIQVAPWQSFVNIENLGWATLPVFAMLILGLSFQGLFLEKYVIKPIFSLVDTAEAAVEPSKHWPFELQKIAADLATSFQAREQAVFAMLARGVIHDLKTLLHSLLTATELVQEQSANPEKRVARMEALLRASMTNLPKMKRIIELTLDGSQEIPIRMACNDLAKTVQGAIDAIETQATASHVAVTLRVPPGQLMAAHDAVQLERALTNLIKNGIEAAAPNDQHSRRVDVGVTAKAKGFTVSIDDSGDGLPLDAAHLFKPVKSTKLHGAGLGLYIAGKIIRSHGGVIRAARSATLGGASFTIEIQAMPQLSGSTL